jgi:hypothetical protein
VLHGERWVSTPDCRVPSGWVPERVHHSVHHTR